MSDGNAKNFNPALFDGTVLAVLRHVPRGDRIERVANDRIEINPKKLCGKPVIRGTRIPVYVILDLLAEGWTHDRIREEYPPLKDEDIAAAIRFAAELARFEETPLAGASE